jgi:SAM-dependent methyltransferase
VTDEGLVPRFARPALRAGDVTGWFEPVYAAAGERIGDVPWVDQEPNELLVSWLAREGPAGDARRAVVVGCGLGDDVEALREAGYDATGFDVAPTAIAWAARRFPGSAERFRVANLLDLPPDLVQAFDLVFEAYTVQALPQSVREPAIDGVASLVAPGGRLLVVCSGRDPEDDPGRLPWPLTRDDLERFAGHGLAERRFEDIRQGASRQFRVRYERPV